MVELINKYNSSKVNIQDLQNLLKDDDNSIRAMAEEELKQETKNFKLIEKDLLKLLIPKDTNDGKNSILEIRAGTGGLEASLFCSDLFRMYEKVCSKKKWKIEIINISFGEMMYKFLKYFLF